MICAEGYLFECERRGYLQAGAYVPEVVLEHPEVVAELHREFVHAGSDVVEAFTYYAHREKLATIGREDDLEPLHRQALAVARRDPEREPPGGQPFPTALDPFVCTRYELGDFAREAFELGVTYLGVCCGAGPHHIRAVAEAIGRRPPASRYSPDMSKHAYLGTDARIPTENRDFAEHL